MFFIYILLFAQYVAQSSVPAIQSQSKTIINSATNPVYQTVDVNYMSTPFPNSPWVVLSLTSLTNEPNTTTWGFRFNILMPPLINKFTVEQTIMGPSTIINYAVIRYLAIDKTSFPNFVMRYINTSLSGSITSGTGLRNQQFVLSVNGGYFYANQTTSLMSYITGFAGTFDNATGFQLSASSTVLNSTHFTLLLQTDGTCNFTQATAYTFAFFNNLYSQGDLGYLYGVSNQQLNQYTYRVGPNINYFVGLTYFKFPQANMVLDLVNLYDINSTGYTDITFTYLYFNYADPCTRSSCMCYDGYDLVNGSCQEICGDGRVFTLPCDDGNLNDFDGCSAICQRQPSYFCLNTGARSQSVCWFNDTIKFELVSSNRLPFSFTTNLTLRVIPNLTVLETYDWSSIVPPTIQIQTSTYSNGILILLISYQSTIQLQPMTLSTSQQSPIFQRMTPSASTIQIATNQQQYSFYDSLLIPTVIQYSSIALCALFYLSFIFSLYLTKIIGAQMMSMFQIAYYGILITSIKASSAEYLHFLKYVSYSPLFPCPQCPYGYSYYFLNSYSLLIATLLAPILLHFVLLLVDRKKKTKAKRTTKDLILAMFLYNTYPIWISAVFQHKLHELVFHGIVAIVLMVAVLAMFIAYSVSSAKFKECMQLLKSSLHRYYPSCMFVDRIILSTVLAWSTSIYAVTAWQFLMFVLAWWKPFEKQYQNVRLIITQGIIVLILAIYCVMHSVSFQQRTICEYLPLGIIVLLLAGLILNVVMMVRTLRQDLEEKKKEKEEKQKVKEMLTMETTFMQVMKDKVERDWNKSFYEEGLKSNRRVKESKISGFLKY